MNIIGLIIYFIPNKKKSERLFNSDECEIKSSFCEDVVYDRGKQDKPKTGKLEMDCDEPSLVKIKNKDFTKYKIGAASNNSYYRYEKTDECSITSDEKKAEEPSRTPYAKKSEEYFNYPSEKKGPDEESYDSNISYDKKPTECDETYVRERSPYCTSEVFGLQQTDECPESPRKQRFGHLYGEERKRKQSGQDQQPTRPSELKSEMYNKRPEMKIYIETSSREFPPVSGDEHRASRSSRTEPKITIIKSPSVELEESVPIAKPEGQRKSKTSATHFSMQMTELDEQIKGKMEKLQSYSATGVDEKRSSAGRVGKPSSHVSILSERGSPTMQANKMTSYLSVREELKESSVSRIRDLSSMPRGEDERGVSFGNAPEKAPSLTKKPSLTAPKKSSLQTERTSILSRTSAQGQEERVHHRELTFTPEATPRKSERPTAVHISEDRDSKSMFPSTLQESDKLSHKKVSRKSSRTSVSVNSMILVESLEALALAKLITNELNHAIKKDDSDKLSQYKNQSKDSVVQRSEVELLVLPRELLKIQKKIETKLNTIIRQGGPKCSYVKELKKFFPYHYENKAIFPCNINYVRSDQLISQRLLHKLLKKLEKKYDEVQTHDCVSKRNTHDNRFVVFERKDKNRFKSVAHQSNRLENRSKLEDRREDLFVEKSNKQAKFGHDCYQNYGRARRPMLANQESEIEIISGGENKYGKSLTIKKELKPKSLTLSPSYKQIFHCDNETSEYADDYKIASVIKKLYNNDSQAIHRYSSEEKSCAKRILKLKVIAEDLKRIHSDLSENLQNLRKFISERPRVTTQNAGDYVKEMCENSVFKELSRNILKDRYSPLLPSKFSKIEETSTFIEPNTPPLQDTDQNTRNSNNDPQGSIHQNERSTKINRYQVKTKPSYKFKGKLHMKHVRDFRRKKALKTVIWKHLFQEVMRETLKNSSVKTLLSVLNQEKLEKRRSSKKKTCKSDVNEKNSLLSKTSTSTTRKSSYEVISSEASVKQDDGKIKPSTSTSETFMIEEIEKSSNKYSQSSQIKMSESTQSEQKDEVKTINKINNNTNKITKKEITENSTPVESSKINSSKSLSINSSSLDKLECNSVENSSNGKEMKDSWTSIISQEDKINNDKQELKRSLTEVLDLLTRPCPELVDSQKDLSNFNSENSNEDTMNMSHDTHNASDSIYSLTPKMMSSSYEEDMGAMKTMSNWKNAFDIVLQYSVSSKEINVVEEGSLDNHLESDVL